MERNIKESVKSYYGKIAKNIAKGVKSSCCSTSCYADISSGIYDKEQTEGLPKEAIVASLGCAAPLLFANIQEGEIVLDLGSGGGIDVLQASSFVGSTGKIYGIDMTDEMLELANQNKKKSGVDNVEFVKGYIENMPFDDNTFDVIISNCVINLTEDKEVSLSEVYRVLKPNGRIAIADVITLKDVPEKIKKITELWVGCIAGTIKLTKYQEILEKIGYKNIEIKPIHIYTKEHIRSISKLASVPVFQNLAKKAIEQLDGAFASASIIAYK